MATISETLLEIYTRLATARYGLSAVNQLEHGLQSATIAQNEGGNAAFVTAALLHDIGHMVHELGENPAAAGIDDAHEAIGAAWLSRHFGPDVTEPIRLHVPAKRYLCATDPSYFDTLAEDSVTSLALQGGPMSPAEIAQFEKNPFFTDAVRLRRIDERAKDQNAVTPSFEEFLPTVAAALRTGFAPLARS